ncbi:MAG: DUF3194 domain-containing protein [Methanopyri archaeon]|nr:DUF3194 domain-containing protein [Methanopyri archaeon]
MPPKEEVFEKAYEAAMSEISKRLSPRDVDDVNLKIVVDGKDVEVEVDVKVHPLAPVDDEEVEEAVEKAADAAMRVLDRFMREED